MFFTFSQCTVTVAASRFHRSRMGSSSAERDAMGDVSKDHLVVRASLNVLNVQYVVQCVGLSDCLDHFFVVSSWWRTLSVPLFSNMTLSATRLLDSVSGRG